MQEPIMPSILQKAKDDAASTKAKGRAEKSTNELMPRFPGFLNNPAKVHLVKREGRPDIKFVDVGGKFLDVRDRKERMKRSERRRRIKDEKQDEAKKAQEI
jgi:hypothetical protein